MANITFRGLEFNGLSFRVPEKATCLGPWKPIRLTQGGGPSGFSGIFGG